jgi:isopentenyl diphosphate isomerase/L-lactate dehydrogenase-like FMN-dependent dehydrogenase
MVPGAMSDQPPIPFGNYQYEIYLQGLAGQLPELPVAWDALEDAAASRLDDGARGYVFGGAGSEDTQRENVAALGRWRIVPRMLRDVAARDVRTAVLGTEMPAPVLLAPVGVQSIIHPEGELAVARAAGELGVPMVASTASSFTLEEIAEAGGAGAPRWFQLYWPKDDDLAASFIARAEAAGYGAIVVTLDTPLLAWRPRDLQGAYLPFLKSIGIANYLADPVFRAALDKPPEEDPQAAVGHFVLQFSNPGATWAGIDRLRALTDLPLVLKGINHPDDARQARERGVDGVLVSNHGGRQVDGALAAIDALPGVVEAVGDDLTILFDSGIRGGADVVKAIALGADATLIGRPYLWGLALAGADGVKTVVRSLLAELDLTLALSGHSTLHTLGPEILTRRPA